MSFVNPPIASPRMERLSAATASVALLSKDKPLSASITAVLSDSTTTVRLYPSLNALLTGVASIPPDVVILDDRDEAEASLRIRLLRRRQPSLYLVFIGVDGEERSITLLHHGADDAIVAESPTLMARLQSATRRARTLNAGARIALGDIVFDRESRRVWCAGREVELTPNEYSVVDCLFWHAPTPVGVDTLADFVWGNDESTNRRASVQTYVSYVRKKLAKSGQLALEWSRGLGYQFSPKQRKKR